MKTSNSDVNWAKMYDFYELEMRNIYRTVSKPQNDSHYEMLKDKGAKFLSKNNTFCEIGFSAGLTLRHALNHFGHVYGLDISPKNVELTAKELDSEGFSNFELYTSDLMVFDERFNNKFDVISYIHGLEHFTTDDYPVIFKNIKKYLKSNGVFTGALPFNNQFKYLMCPNCSHVFEADGHVSTHDKTSLKKLFEDNGFEIIHLDNFNMKYALSRGSSLKRIYRFVMYGILGKQSNAQLEYIVRPR
jgi:cyclopropane fatty-acyl-phospholipid synthase-like methyltransferase